MYYTQIKEKLSSLIELTSWEQVLFAMSQLASDIEVNSDENEDSESADKFNKLADNLHDLSNLMG